MLKSEEYQWNLTTQKVGHMFWYVAMATKPSVTFGSQDRSRPHSKVFLDVVVKFAYSSDLAVEPLSES